MTALTERQLAVVKEMQDFSGQSRVKALLISLPNTYFGMIYALLKFIVELVQKDAYKEIVYVAPCRLMIQTMYTDLCQALATSASLTPVKSGLFADESYFIKLPQCTIHLAVWEPSFLPDAFYIFDGIEPSHYEKRVSELAKVVWISRSFEMLQNKWQEAHTKNSTNRVIAVTNRVMAFTGSIDRTIFIQ